MLDLKFKIGKKLISNKSKTYFIADIAANHDGKLSRALKLIRLAAEAGADAAADQGPGQEAEAGADPGPVFCVYFCWRL